MMNRTYLFGVLGTCLVCIFCLSMLLTGAFGFYTDYTCKRLQAESGVSLLLSKSEGISDVAQSGYLITQGDEGFYRSEGTAYLEADTARGYRFDGWFAGEERISGDPHMAFIVKSYTELHARAELIPYPISYFPNGGTVNPTAPSSYTVLNGVTLPVPVRDGYVFEGWYESEAFEGEATTGFQAGTIGEKRYYAKWTKAASERVYALVLNQPKDSENLNPMIFVRTSEPIAIGGTYQSKTYGALEIIAFYTDFEQLDIDMVSDTHSVKVSSVPWAAQKENVTSVVIEDEITPVSTAFWFYEFYHCRYLDVSKMNSESLMNTAFTFYDTGAKADDFSLVGLGAWDVSKVRNMESMFENIGYYATTMSVEGIDGWNVSNVENMKGMFRDAGYRSKTWDIGDLSQWDTSSVTEMEDMFFQAGRMATTFDLGNLGSWDVSHVGSLYRMFYYAGYAATTFYIGNLDSWNVSNVENMEGMFYGSGYSTTAWSIGDLSNWDVSKVRNMGTMFGQAGRKSTSWSIGNIGKWNVSNVEKMQSMFDNAGYASKSFYLGNLENWDTGKVTNMSYMFYNAGYGATWSLDCSGWDVSSVTNHTNFNRNATGKVVEPVWN